MFYAINVEDRIRRDHPLRPIKRMVDEELAKLSRQFDKAYCRDNGRPSIPPERLLKALLLQCLYSIRSETQLVERIDTDLLFRWFLDMDPAVESFDQTSFTHNRPRLEAHGLVQAFFDGVVRRAIDAGLTSHDHFSVDGTLIESHASIKSFVPKEEPENKNDSNKNDSNKNDSNKNDSNKNDSNKGGGNPFKSRNPEVDFHGQKRSNDTHVSGTDPEARLYRKSTGQEARLCHMGHTLAENRHGLILAVAVTEASGTAEPEAALSMLDNVRQRYRLKPKTCGADKGYDGGPFLRALQRRNVTPHVPTKAGKIGGEHAKQRKDQADIRARQRMRRREKTLGYRLSQRCRKRIEEGYGWLKTVAGLVKTRLVGRWKIRQQMTLGATAYNLVRLRSLTAA
jgi:transposase